MKLLGCHIDNFGAFHDYDLTFNDGLNVIMQANGWGKTTLAAYVKAMLYGFEGKRVRDVAANERLRYRPWQGGRYGGSLDFEAGGREFRVIREFGATAAKDSLKIVDIETGKSTMSETGEDVGEWLFGLDASAFQKSVYVVQNGFGFDGSTAGLRNRLNSLVNEADDVAGFDKAQAALEVRRKHYKKTGNRGAIADISKGMAKLVDADAQADARIADLRNLGAEIDGYTASIKTIDDRIAEVQTIADEDQAAVQQEQALLKVGSQLRKRQQEAKAAYDAAVSSGAGKAPTADEIGKAREVLAEIKRLGGEADEADRAAMRAVEARQAIAVKYAKGIPEKQEIQGIRDRIADVAARERAAVATQPEVDEELGRVRATIAADPGLLERAESVASRHDEIAAAAADGAEAASELSGLRAQWGEKRKRISQLANEARAKVQAVPADAERQSAELRRDAHGLRSASSKLTRLDSRIETLKSHLEEAKSELDAIHGGRAYDASDVEALDVAAKAASSAAGAVNDARKARDSKASALPALRQATEAAQAKLDEQKDASEQAKPGLPVSAIACIALAVVAIALGVVLGPAGAVSFGLYAAGAVLVVAGAVLFTKRKPAASAEPDAADVNAVDAARSAYDRAKEEAERAEAELASAEESARNADAELFAIVSRLFPDETFDNATLAAQAPVLKQRMSARAEREAKVDEAQRKVEDTEAERNEVAGKAGAITAKHEDVGGNGYDECAEAMEARASKLADLAKDAEDAKRRLVEAIAAEMGADPASLDSEETETFLAALGREEPPNAESLAAKTAAARKAVESYVEELNELLGVFRLETVDENEMAVGAERIIKAVADYRVSDERERAAKRKSGEEANKLAEDKATIETWAQKAGVSGIGALTEEWFAAVSADIAANEKASWEEQQAKEKSQAARRDAANLQAQMGSFFVGYGIDRPEDPAGELETLAKRADSAADLKRASELADRELEQWLAENEKAVKSAAERAKNPHAQSDAARQLGLLRQQRDTLVADRAQREEQRAAVLESLENRLAVQQELELLSKQKQDATANLFTIQKTAEYLENARDGLDGRYLGDLADRFGDYASAWLNGEQVEAKIDSDFGVALYDGAEAHDVAGYSTGYQDLLDICFRMALVDTVFQAEPPFLIMDDPFTSLDEEKIRRAFLLLQALAEKYQVIYFTCHPSRMEASTVTGSAAFVLPEQRARRELPRARARREAEERARAQAELVASYAVVPVTGGRASIRPAGRRNVNSNLLNIVFEVDETGGSRDNSFEVHFIDEKGRVLCDRQTVEVIGGRTVPEKVRFSLNTRDDSGSAYDMIIHEDGREPAELAARVPFKAEVSFASDDFGL